MFSNGCICKDKHNNKLQSLPNMSLECFCYANPLSYKLLVDVNKDCYCNKHNSMLQFKLLVIYVLSSNMKPLYSDMYIGWIYCTCLQFLPNHNRPDWNILKGSNTPCKPLQADGGTWTIHEQSSCDPSSDAMCEVPVEIQFLPAVLCQSFGHRRKLLVPEACNTSVTSHVCKLRMGAYL